jgi:hypothetical protein
MRKSALLFIWTIYILFSACTDKPEPVPVYVKLQPFAIQDPQGPNMHQVTEGWLYVNGDFLGVYPLPGEAPVLADGPTEIFVFPGIKENGVSTTPNIYDFFTRYETNINLTSGVDVTIQPSTQYKSQAIFAWPVDKTTFDGATPLVIENKDEDEGSGFELTTSGAFSGRSIKMQVDSAHPKMDIVTEAVTLPTTGGQQVWLEMHYKNDQTFLLSMLGGSGANEYRAPVGPVAVNNDWKKIYINLTEYVVEVGTDKQRLLFQVSLPRDNTGKYTQKTGTIYLDNIRLIHF